MPSLLISDEEFRTLPHDIQSALIARFLPSHQGNLTASDQVGQNEDGEGPPELSPAQAKKFLTACSERTKNILRQIAIFPSSGFRMSDLEEKLGLHHKQLTGSWAGITKVCRRITGDDNSTLIWWIQENNGEWHGRISAMTHKSFRKAFGIS